MWNQGKTPAKTLLIVAASAILSATSMQAQLTENTETATSVAPLTPQEISHMLDPQMAKVLDVYNSIKGTPAVKLTPRDARQQFAAEDAAKILARATGKQEAPMKVGKVTDGLTIEGSDGNQIPIRIYTPAGSGPFPVVLYFHGGGFVIATIDTYDASPRALADYANAIVVSVEYRKAPEAPFPAALHDAISSYKWVLENIGKYDGNAKKVAVAGESAGGNLATEVAIEARDQKLQAPTHQLLIYPVTSSNVDQPSDILYEYAVPLNTPLLKYFFKYYVPESSEANNPEVAPIEANLENLPPATIIAAQIDPLQSDGQAYAKKLQQAKDTVTYRLYPGTTHEFFGMGAVVDKAKEAEYFAASQLAASFK
jgi:acetyl esterase